MEKVQLSLERFLPELRDLERRQIFSKDELDAIVTQRKQFEVSLSSKQVKEINFIHYINYEKSLEKLRLVRVKRQAKSSETIKTKKTLSDHSIAAHITYLHASSNSRFPHSTQLWSESIAHSLLQASPLLVSKTLSRAISYLPSQSSYWILASRFESEGTRSGLGGGNVEGARRLCMRALRFLKGGAGEQERMDLWKEWIRLEVAYVEKLRKRWEVLGIHSTIGGEMKKKEKVIVVNEEGEEVEEDEAVVEVPLLPNEVLEEDKIPLTGTEALIEGAVVRVVLDNALSSFNHSLLAYTHLIHYIRTLATPLRLPLLAHVYASLREHSSPTSSDYPQVVHLLATPSLYDVSHTSEIAEVKGIQLDVTPASSTAGAGNLVEPAEEIIRVRGEPLVDALGKVIDAYWKVLKSGKKGKGKGMQEIGDLGAIWEKFCDWLMMTLEAVGDDATDLTNFLDENLTLALSICPPSAYLSLLRYHHLTLLGEDSIEKLDAHTVAMIKQFASASSPTPLATKEELWVARLAYLSEAMEEIDDDGDVQREFETALEILPFSGKLWDLMANWKESRDQGEESKVVDWYEWNIRFTLSRSTALAPAGFVSKFTQVESARDVLPARYVNYLILQHRGTPFWPVLDRLTDMMQSSSALPMNFLRLILARRPFSLGSLRTDSRMVSFRSTVHSTIVLHPEATYLDWISYAEELIARGNMVESKNVMERARRACTMVGTAETLEKAWTALCDRL